MTILAPLTVDHLIGWWSIYRTKKIGDDIMAGRNKIAELDSLVEELMKDLPDETIVRDLMVHLKLPYSTDPIERINKVLLKLHPPIEDIAATKNNKEVRREQDL